MVDQFNELGIYALAGAPEFPQDMIGERQAAEKLRIGMHSLYVACPYLHLNTFKPADPNPDSH